MFNKVRDRSLNRDTTSLERMLCFEELLLLEHVRTERESLVLLRDLLINRL